MVKVIIIGLILVLDLLIADPIPFIDEAGLALLFITSVSSLRTKGRSQSEGINDKSAQ